MGNPIASRPSSLPDHMSPDGDAAAVRLVITVHASGAMSVVGPIEEKLWCLAALDMAKDVVRNHRGGMAPGQLIVPSNDVDQRVKL